MSTYTYDLAFRTAKEAKQKQPEIVFIIEEQYLELVYDRLAVLNSRFMNLAHTYFDGKVDTFISPKTDLFGGFGYGDCGYVTKNGDEAQLHIPLRSGHRMLEATYTIHILAMVLAVPFDEERQSNRDQQVSLETRADRYSRAGWGHMLAGYVGPSLIRWLQRYGSDHRDGIDSFWSAPLPEEVLQAMQITWRAITEGSYKRYADEIRGRISHEGRFLMTCFGNACDISIYPDQWIHDDCEHVRFACHNLDNPDQQLTLLAGLAKLCELARQET